MFVVALVTMGADPSGRGSKFLPRSSTTADSFRRARWVLSRQANGRPHLHGEKVRRGEDIPLGFQELPPRRPLLTLRTGLDPVPPEDGGDGPTPNLVA